MSFLLNVVKLLASVLSFLMIAAFIAFMVVFVFALISDVWKKIKPHQTKAPTERIPDNLVHLDHYRCRSPLGTDPAQRMVLEDFMIGTESTEKTVQKIRQRHPEGSVIRIAWTEPGAAHYWVWKAKKSSR